MKTLKLAAPLPYGDTTLDELTFRDPHAGDLRGLKLGGLGEMDVNLILALTRRLANVAVTDEQLAMLSPFDLLKVTETIVDFFAASAPSPTTP
jgi:hypothetical protein